MKKVLVLLISIIVLTGCTSNDLSKDKEAYLKYIKDLREVKNTTSNIPFEIEVKYDKITNHEVRYQVIIDNVKEDIFNIEALAVHNKETDDIFPSIGIFDEKQDLLKDKKPSGVILVGYINYQGEIKDFKCKIKLLVKYKTNDKKNHKIYYVTKK